MRKQFRATFILAAILPAATCHADADTPGGRPSAETFRSWPQVAANHGFRLEPMTEKRVGFTLAPEAQGRRVIVALSAFVEAPAASGYTQSTLALDVNGEVMGLTVEGRSRLLNRPLTFRFGAGGEHEQIGGVEGRLGLIENWGSARWTLPAAPSIEAWLSSVDYRPAGLRDNETMLLRQYSVNPSAVCARCSGRFPPSPEGGR